MSRYIDADKALEDADTIDPKYKTLIEQVKRIINAQPSADVVEVGKAYPREEFEKYGLSEWKDKHGQRWVMIERRDNE